MVDPTAERGVLAGFFQHGVEAFDDVSDLLSPSSFDDEVNQVIYRCAQHHFAEHGGRMDYPTLMSSARSLGLEGHFASAEQVRYARGVATFPVRKENVRKLAKKAAKLAAARELSGGLIRAGEELRGITGDESIDHILALADGPVAALVEKLSASNRGCRLMGEGAEEYVDYLADNPREMMGVSTGFPLFDMAIGGGSRENSLDVIAARMKTGKTMLVDAFALHMAGKLGVPVLNVDTEMNQEEHLHRVLANMTDTPIHDIEKGKFPRAKLKEAASRLRDMPYHYECVIGKGWEEILSSVRRWLRKVPRPARVIFDYLKMMDAEFVKGDLKEHQALGFIASGLKNLMGSEKAGCVAFAQLNRDGIDREDTDVVAFSDRIGMFATSVSLFKRKTEDERNESDRKYTHKIINLFGRHGGSLHPGDYINVAAEFDRGRATEGPTASQLAKRGGAKKEAGEGVRF